ncbi:hypothetical protein F5Y16DRAFT_341536 [Xylariaceae sp. FL0255]|nr:hypothetical protein F5Y16DRAFT_341536 [Xylariaceae sp. FL0255]
MTITALYSTVTSTYYNSNGKPTKTQVVAVLRSAQQTTLDDGYGYPTATENYYEVQSLSTIYSDKVPVSTETISIPEVLTTSYLTNSDGKTTETSVFLVPLATEIKAFSNAPTPTASASPNTTSQSVTLQRLPDGLYFSGIMLPTIVAILISIPIRVLYHNVSLYQGFHALASDGPARAADSLCLKTTGPGSIVASFRSLQTRHYFTEAFRPVLSGSDCINGSSDQMTCSVNIGIYPVTAQIVAAFLVLLIVGMAFVAFKLWRWDTGVSRNPWNMTFMADLGGTELQRILGRWRRSNHKIENEELRKFLGGNIFELGLWELNGIRRYGVLVYTGHGVDNSEKLGIIRCCWPKGSDFLPFFMLSITGRVLLLLLLGAVLVVVLIYDTVAQGSEYQRGLTGKAIGVRFLFSGFGVLATIAWGSFFSSVAFMSPYRLLNRRRIFTAHAKYVCPPTNPFSGVWLAFVKSRRDIYLGIVSGTAILSEFLPLFLGNIPSNNIEAESAQTVCVWLSVSIVSLMALTVAGSFFVKWPEMDIDPSTIIGAMYVAIEPNVKRFINRAERV